MKKSKKKPKRRRRKKPVSSADNGNTVPSSDSSDDSDWFGPYAVIGGGFGVIGGLLIAIDMYSEVGLLGTLILTPFAAVLCALMGIVAVYLRALVSAVIVPVMMVLFVGVIAYSLIWGSPDSATEKNTEKNSVEQLAKDR